MNDLVLSQVGVRVIDDVPMMGSRSLMSICGVGEHKHFVEAIKKLFKVEKIDFSDIKGVFVELHREGPKKGCIKEIWFDRPRASAVAGSYNFQYNLLVHEEFDRLSNQKQGTPSYQIEDPVLRAERWIVEYKEKKLLEAKIEDDKPKVAIAEAYLTSDGLKTVSQWVKENKHLGIKNRKFFETLREKGYLLKDNRPSDAMVEKGYFKSVEVECKGGVFRSQTYITREGELWLTKNAEKFK